MVIEMTTTTIRPASATNSTIVGVEQSLQIGRSSPGMIGAG